MSDKELISRGAECVMGDLLLRRVLMGMHRNGQFILTPEGAEELAKVVEVEAEAVVVPVKPKGKSKAIATSLDDDLAGLDAAL